MSLVSSKHRKTKSYAAKKKQIRPDWDSTVNDLTEFRATPEEVARRQEAHRSKNLELVRKSAIEKRLASARRQALGDFTNKPNTGNAFLREILYSNGQVDQILDDTSKALQVAHDIFADDARRYKAVPAITAIDSSDEENAVYSNRPLAADGLIKSNNQSQSRLEKLSESVMRKTALNDTYSASSSETDSCAGSVAEGRELTTATEETTPVTSEPLRVDLRRFQRLIEQEELSTIASSSTAGEAVSKGNITTLSSPLVGAVTAQTDETNVPEDGHRGKKTPKRRKSLPSAESTDLKSLLESLESCLSQYERKHFIKGDNFIEDAQANSLSMSTFTVALMSVLQRMVGYFNNLQDSMSEDRRRAAIKEQQQLDLTNRTNCLTKELIEVQEQVHVVLDELNRVKTEQRQEIDALKATVSRMAKGGTVHVVPVAQPQAAVVQARQANSNQPMVLRQSATAATVTSHKEFEGSPEQIKLLNSSQHEEGGPLAVPKPPADASPAAEREMTLEQRIGQLREDHQDTLERFRKLGMEMQKQPAASWQPIA